MDKKNKLNRKERRRRERMRRRRRITLRAITIESNGKTRTVNWGNSISRLYSIYFFDSNGLRSVDVL